MGPAGHVGVKSLRVMFGMSPCSANIHSYTIQASRSANPLCSPVLWKGEDYFLPVICLCELHYGIVELEELVDDFWVLNPVKDGDDSDVGNKFFCPNRGGLNRRGFPNALGLLKLAVLGGDGDIGVGGFSTSFPSDCLTVALTL